MVTTKEEFDEKWVRYKQLIQPLSILKMEFAKMWFSLEDVVIDKWTNVWDIDDIETIIMGVRIKTKKYTN